MSDATSNTYESLEVGDSFAQKRTITEEEVRTFAELTGDDNPLHVDPDYAANTRFGKPIIHGVLLLGVFSKILGHDFPGHGTIAVSLSTRFLRPAPVGSEIEFRVQITDKVEKRQQVKARVRAYLDEKIIMGGEAVMIPPSDGEAPVDQM